METNLRIESHLSLAWKSLHKGYNVVPAQLMSKTVSKNVRVHGSRFNSIHDVIRCGQSEHIHDSDSSLSELDQGIVAPSMRSSKENETASVLCQRATELLTLSD